MLEHTFIHIKGIGRKTEQGLWERGIRTWRDFLETRKPVLSPARDRFIKSELETSTRHLDDIRFFSDRLSSGDMWRLFKAFEEKAVYLDIETSGGYQGMDEITVIGLYDGKDVYTFVSGRNLDQFETAISDYDLVITFNGATFDLPFIRRAFKNISLPAAHIDLRYVLKRLGYRGGLKKIEKVLGILRGPDIDGMDGYEAVRLWRAYTWGDNAALARLIQYNTADIVNLKPLMERGYAEMKGRLFSLGD
ncbi:MAG: exonuclease [Deltaproteobacteria bacterium]|nr:exonuclease [Deltaproteobacteria bacterium]